MNMQATLNATASEPTKNPLIYKIAVVMGLMMTIGGSLTGAMTYMQLGFDQSFFSNWLQSFIGVAIFMMPLGFVFTTTLTLLTNKLLPKLSEMKRNLIVGLLMAVLMESMMAFVTTVNNIGLESRADFISGWIDAFVVAIPIGLTLMVTMSLTIKPKIENFLKS
ncbi:DUF2798 domain-containing protein [Alginatibacterium sediminis]|uniref:DUF2798 domain-containing protein n=1 Tax=Alginatibacterium sediminis TaxID=2164068 RepID=A0A420EBD7_9ALTE|nr:DUF2798 domain-containing protein [Alginatibacterium sediminis]RKF18000.1 DUF2798 domain-containing protein [Alginatibacterium sediminis]